LSPGGWLGSATEGRRPQIRGLRSGGSLALPARPQPPTICHPSRPDLEPGLKQVKEAVEAIGRGEPFSIPETVDESFEEQPVRLLGQGQKIEAIKLYRERTGAGLKEAKDAVEVIQRGERPQDLENGENQFHQDLVSLLQQGRKIDAIKAYREVTGSGLKESKDVIESIADRYGLMGSQRTGCLGLIVFTLVILGVGFALV
jgi:ribosomal protein L7/L12